MGSDLKRAFTEDGQRRTHIGGQALIEGVMMRGKLYWAVAVREPGASSVQEGKARQVAFLAVGARVRGLGRFISAGV